MAVNITRHCLERYVERIKGITDKTEKNAYITNNRERLEEHINTMFSNSEFVFRGKIGGDLTSKNFYLIQDIGMVLSDDNNLITIFKINFDFPEEAKLFVIDSLVKNIRELEDKFKLAKQRVDEEISLIENQKEQSDNEIRELEARIKLLKDKNTTMDMHKKTMLQETALIATQQQRYAHQLFGATSYKEDIVKK